jgi:predicted RNase H-like nuclease (RuvC/YqgF family)
MYKTYQKINALNEAMISLSLTHDKSKAKAANDYQSLLIAFENHKEFVDKKFKDLVDRIGAIESLLLQSLAKFREIKQEVELDCLKKQEFEEAISNLDNLVISQKLTQSLKNDNFNQYLTQLKAKIEQDIMKLKEELESKPSPVEPLKRHLDERFNSWKVDMEGLVKEIAILKKGMAYDQKKFEHIYTLIERFKEAR